MNLKETHKYDDIIQLPHFISKRRVGMTVLDRAAQFSPFSALTGYEDVIRSTEKQVEAEYSEDSSSWQSDI